jgi:hypothetical protein
MAVDSVRGRTTMLIRRPLVLALLAACDVGGQAESPRAAVPTAHEDGRGGIRPYDPSRTPTLTFEGVDIGDEPLHAGAQSEADLGAALVAGLAARDAAALTALALDVEEHARLYPVLIHHPNAAKAGPAFAWSTLQRESRGDLHTAVERYGGRALEFVRFAPREVLERPKVRILVRPTVVVRTEAGLEEELVVLGSILEHVPSGTWKIIAFRDTR